MNESARYHMIYQYHDGRNFTPVGRGMTEAATFGEARDKVRAVIGRSVRADIANLSDQYPTLIERRRHPGGTVALILGAE